MSGQLSRLDQLDERTGDGAVTYVSAVWAGDHEEDIDSIARKVGYRSRVGEFVESPLDSPHVAGVKRWYAVGDDAAERIRARLK